MSAECGKCGADITYPAGTWPVGSCEPCDLRAELTEARRVGDELREALRSLFRAHVHRFLSIGSSDNTVEMRVSREVWERARAAVLAAPSTTEPPGDTKHCPTCGAYMPLSLDGTRRVPWSKCAAVVPCPEETPREQRPLLVGKPSQARTGEGDIVDLARAIDEDEACSPASTTEPPPTEGLPPDLARVLRDHSIVVPQDATVFDLIATWANAPSNTASGATTEPPGDPT